MSQEVKDNFLHSFFSDEDLFPGCKFDEHLNLISIVDPFPFETSLLTSSLDEPKQSSEVEPVVDGRSSSFSESFTQSVYLDEEKETNSFNWSTHATASSHASQSFERFLSDVSINEKSLSQVSSVASFSSMGFFPYADLSKVKQTATYIQPRPSLSQSHPIHSYSILKSMSKAPGRSNAISRWRVEKRALYLKTRQSQEKRETALKNLMETAETIVLGIQAQQALKKKHRPTPALSRPSEKIKDQVPGLQAIKKFYEKKRNRIQERMKWVERKRILREKNSIAIQVKLQNEFQSIPKSSCSSPLLSSLPKEGDQQKKDAHTTIIRLPSIGAQEFEKTKKILAHSRKSLSKLPNEFQPLLKSSCTDEKSMLKKSFPLPIIHPKQLSTSLSGPLTIPTKVPNNDPLRPHPHLHASPSSLTFSRSQPCLQIKFTNTLDSVLRVSLLPMELDLEDRFTFTSTPTLSLAKGISLSTQVHLKVHDNEVLKDTKVLGLRVLVNGELCVWPLMIEGDRMSLACRPSTQIDFEFTNPSQQVLQLKNTGTLMGDVEVHSTTSMVSWSPSQFSLAPAQSQRFIVQFTPPNNEEKPSLQTSKSSNHWSSLTNHYALLLEKLTFSYPKQNCQPLLEIPIRIHLPLVPFIVEPKHTQFFYCPTTLQVKTTFTLVNQLRHSLRFTIKTQCIPSVNDIQVLVKPEQSLLQVGSPLSIQVQLKCEEPIKMPTCMQVACHLTIQTKEEEKKKSFSQTCVLQGTFFNPDFQLSVHHLQWSSMGIMETYSSPLTIRNPTPVFMTLGMSCTCPMATVRFTPMTSKDTLVLAPNQTVVGTLHVTPFQSGPLRGQIEWKNLFGVIKAIVLHSEVFQPFATFDTMQYTFPEVCEGHVSRHILHLSWYLNEREQRGVVKYPEERGTFQVCKPEWVRVLNDPTAGPPVEKNCSDLSPHELSALRIYPTQGVIQWGQRCALHVAYAPVPSRVSGRKAMPMDLGSSSMGLTLDPKSVPLPSYPHSPTNDQPNAPVNGSESIDLTINTNLTSGAHHYPWCHPLLQSL
ncbi:hypothetical protein HMI56_006436 [Coelomomyces lativittatus]|nr:hypothetical protein HMI56_006436 [Coelomomyces lativittatus]